MKTRSQSLALRVALGYVVGSALWIVGSDFWVWLRTDWHAAYLLLNMAKGLGFVAATGGLLYLLLQRLLYAELSARNRAQQLVDHMSDGIALFQVGTDGAGNPVTYTLDGVNSAFETITGLPRERLKGKRLTELEELGWGSHLHLFAKVMTTAQPGSFQSQVGNSEKYLSVSVFTPARGQLATLITDITRRRDAERQICLLNQVYMLVSRINEAIVRISDREALLREMCRITVEKGQFRLACVSMADVTGGALRSVACYGPSGGYLAQIGGSSDGFGTQVRAMADLAHGEQRVIFWPEASAPGRGTPESPSPRSGTLYRSGMAIPLKVRGAGVGVFCVFSSEPEFFSAVVAESLIEVCSDVCFALDVIEVNREREREQVQLRIQHSALEAAANAIVITDREGRIEWVNEAFTKLTGYGKAEVLGQTPSVLKSGLHDRKFYQQMWQTIATGRVWQGVMLNKKKDGTLYHEEMTVTPVRNGAEDITHFVAIKQDVTERRRLEQQFLRAQRMQSIGLLAGGVAHDLNNVLAPVLMAVPLLKTDLDARQRNQVLDTLELSVKRGANIVQQVLTFARGVEVQQTLLQLRHMVREVAGIAEETFPRNITVHTVVPADLWLVQADPTQMHQVLLNLAVNARDAMPQGGRLQISVQNVELDHPMTSLEFELLPGRYVCLSVTDTGTGISSEVFEHMFEPFFTTKPLGRGTGLGLSTVMGIVKSHDGLVEVRTGEGTGSTFSVYLPAAPHEVIALPEPPKVLGSSGGGRRILVVDDEPGMLQMMESILASRDYRVVVASDGLEAMEIFSAQRESIQAVITDLMMPRMGGVELVVALRERSPDLPIIAMTGLIQLPGEPEQTEQLSRAGVHRILMKPFHSEDLLQAVEETVGKGTAASA